MQYLLIIAISLVCMLGGRRLFKKLTILDKPKADQKQKRKPVPTILGVFLFLSFVVVVAVMFPEYLQNRILRGLLAAGLIIGIPAFWDEMHYLGKIKRKMPLIIRAISHILAAIVAVYLGDISFTEWTMFGHTYDIPQWFFVIFFVFWSVLCINALNRFDYANGQSSGVGAIGFLTIFLLIWLVVLPQYPNISIEHKTTLIMVQNLSFVLFVLSGIGTVFERRPIGLLRDVGTMFLGFGLAYLSVIGGAKIGTLVVALSLVIFDAIWVGIHRIFVLKSSPMKGDYRHIHHRLVRLGRTRGEVRSFVWIFSLLMMVLMLLQSDNRAGKIIIFVMMATIFFGVNAYLFWIKKLPCGMEKK